MLKTKIELDCARETNAVMRLCAARLSVYQLMTDQQSSEEVFGALCRSLADTDLRIGRTEEEQHPNHRTVIDYLLAIEEAVGETQYIAWQQNGNNEQVAETDVSHHQAAMYEKILVELGLVSLLDDTLES